MLIGYKTVLIIETYFILKYKLSTLNPTHFLKTIVFSDRVSIGFNQRDFLNQQMFSTSSTKITVPLAA